MTIPAYRQSLPMGCEHCYKLTQIDGIRFPDTPEGERGTDIHEILSPYARHCAAKKVPADFAYLDSLCSAIGDEAFTILENCRDTLTIDWQNFFGSEIYFGLDENFRPTWSYDHDGKRVEIDPIWGIEGSGNEPAYCGIIDVLYVLPGGVAARVPDYKSHNRQFPADTDQGKLYTLAVMMHMSKLQEVEFSLKFIRYANVVTTQKYYRSDGPDLMDAMRRKRAQQLAIHDKVANREPLRVHGAQHCTYCPCTLNSKVYPCPIADLNPAINRTPAEWLSFKMAIDAMKRVADRTLHQLADNAAEPIKSQDANGKWYVYEPKEVEVVTVPLFEDDGTGSFVDDLIDIGNQCPPEFTRRLPILDALFDWDRDNKQDLTHTRKGSKPWFCNLRIGWTQLHSYLKANKRELIHNRIRDLATITKAVRYKIEVDAELDDGPAESGWDAAGDEDLEF